MRRFVVGAFGATRRCSLGIALSIALGVAGCGGGEPSTGPDVESAADTSVAPAREAEGLTYIALGDSWIQGAHCNGCRTFTQTHADTLSELLGKPVYGFKSTSSGVLSSVKRSTGLWMTVILCAGMS